MSNSLPYSAVVSVEEFISRNIGSEGLFLLVQEVFFTPGTSVPDTFVVALVEISGGRCRIGLAEYSGAVKCLDVGFDAALVNLNGVEVDLEKPLKLSPCYIPKPWGQEVWYTGVEERGVCGFLQGQAEVPIPWLLSLFPSHFNHQSQLVLLKILDPLPSPVFGDLYFELHEKKQEVYVVTHVDTNAWPDGVGGINLGFTDEALAAYDNKQVFRDSYSRLVNDYWLIRVRIDKLMDEIRHREGVDLNAAVGAETLARWLDSLPAVLLEEEVGARQRMNELIAVKPLKLGDVVKIPCLVPHALQHGVRTVEFQTPVYERLIVSFAQKVLTQQCWDTKRAVELMDLHQYSQEQEVFSSYRFMRGPTGEVIVDFDDFFVVRVVLDQDEEVELDNAGRYVIVMAVKGEITVDNLLLVHEEAALTVATSPSTVIKSLDDGVSALICLPKP